MCTCNGSARILAGNANHIGKSGGFGPNHVISANSAAIITSLFGGKGNVRPYISQVSGEVDGVEIFSNIADVVGGEIPKGYEHLGNVRRALQAIFPGKLVIELPGGKDMGITDVMIKQPCALICPAGTQ